MLLLYDGQGVKVVVYCQGKKNVIRIFKRNGSLLVLINNQRQRESIKVGVGQNKQSISNL